MNGKRFYMENNDDVIDSMEKELQALPKEYPIELALQNKDTVIGELGRPLNLGPFYRFLNNLERGIADKIRITRYSFEGLVSISILKFDGKNVFLVVDPTRNRYSSTGIRTYIGSDIVKDTVITPTDYLMDYYYLITEENKRTIILSYVIRKIEN